jgi:bacterioferritin (cytochrome b1)
MTKDEIIKMLNHALELEHAAYAQYLSHAEIPVGLDSEPIVARLKEIAGDEKKHAEMFRELIGMYLGGVPSTGMDKTRPAKSVREILEINLQDEKTAVDTYKPILEKIGKERDSLPYEFLKLEHQIRHVIMDEQEHITEIKQLLGK